MPRKSKKCMGHEQLDGGSASRGMFPSPARFVALSVLLPGVVAVTNQLLFELSPKSAVARAFLYPSMVAGTAVLSWCVGRYLQPQWFRWLVFAWSLILLDLLTFAASSSGPLRYYFGYMVLLAQISLLILWATLSTVAWQWRLPGVLVAIPAVIQFSRRFASGWSANGWEFMILMATAVVIVVCCGLRLFRFRLLKSTEMPTNVNQRGSAQLHQFGLKHILIWATAMAPFLLIGRGVDLLLFMHVDAQVVFPAVLAAVGITALNMLAIWAVLGRGFGIFRIVIFLSLSHLVAVGISQYFGSLAAKFSTRRPSYLLRTLTLDDWMTWLWLEAALLAALLLFIRANGYLLIRKNGTQLAE
jgi:hypothetical protein